MLRAPSLALVLASGVCCILAGCQEESPNGNAAGSGAAAAANDPFGPFNEADGKFTTTESGLKYRITREGKGEKPQASDTVRVHYEGKLADGSVFDSSYARKEPATFPLGGVIRGWTEGLQLVAVDGMIDLIIPPELGYGSGGGGPIPPNSTLFFTVELLEILPSEQ